MSAVILYPPPGQGTPGDSASTGNSNREIGLFYGVAKGVVLC